MTIRKQPNYIRLALLVKIHKNSIVCIFSLPALLKQKTSPTSTLDYILTIMRSIFPSLSSSITLFMILFQWSHKLFIRILQVTKKSPHLVCLHLKLPSYYSASFHWQIQKYIFLLFLSPYPFPHLILLIWCWYHYSSKITFFQNH